MTKNKSKLHLLWRVCLLLPIILCVTFLVDCGVHQVSLWEGAGIISIGTQRLFHENDLKMITEYFNNLVVNDKVDIIYTYSLGNDIIRKEAFDDSLSEPYEYSEQPIPEDIQNLIRRSNVFQITCFISKKEFDISYSLYQAGASTIHYNNDVLNNVLPESINWEKTGIIVFDNNWYIMYYKDLIDGW